MLYYNVLYLLSRGVNRGQKTSTPTTACSLCSVCLKLCSELDARRVMQLSNAVREQNTTYSLVAEQAVSKGSLSKAGHSDRVF